MLKPLYWLLNFAFLAGVTSVRGQNTGHRMRRPVAASSLRWRFPVFTTESLPNGLRFAVLEDHQLPLVAVTVSVNVRSLVDPAGEEGLSGILERMLQEGTAARSADELAEISAKTGSPISARGFTTIATNLRPALNALADMLMHPIFPQPGLSKQKAEAIANVRHNEASPTFIASRELERLLYGADSPYARGPTEASIARITRSDLVRFHSEYYRPENTTLVIAGDVQRIQLHSMVEAAFGAWQKGSNHLTHRLDAPAKIAYATTIYVVDRPGAAQSVLMVGHVGPARRFPEFYSAEILNYALGGAFLSRLNTNLREKLGYTYGARSSLLWRPGAEPSELRITASVATSKTDSAVLEVARQIRELREVRPIDSAECEAARNGLIKSLPLDFETLESRAAAVMGSVRGAYPLDYYETFGASIRKVTVDAVAAAAKAYLEPEHLVFVVVGDRAKIQNDLMRAGIGPVRVVDPTK